MDIEQVISNESKSIVNDAISIVIKEKCSNIELVEIKYSIAYKKLNLTIFIWKKDGVSLNDCELVHNLVSEKLDEFSDSFVEDYVLNVSSMGLDRKIVTNDDFRRALDTEIEIIDDQKKKTHGTLISYNDEEFEIKCAKSNKTIKRNNLIKVQPFIKF